MKAFGIGCTNIGMARERNEDAVLVDDDLGIYAVADGIGGRRAGDVASRMALAEVQRYLGGQRELLIRIRHGYVSEELLMVLATSAVIEASREVYRQGLRTRRYRGMGCTLTLILVGAHKAAMAHVGDSRLYLHRGHQVTQLSADHTLARELIRRGVLSEEDEARVPGGDALTRAVGVDESVQVDELLINIQPGDMITLCTDGLWRYIEQPEELGSFCLHHPTSAGSLIDYANRLGGQDNISAVVVRVDAHDDAEEKASSDWMSSGISDTLRILRETRSDELPV